MLNGPGTRLYSQPHGGFVAFVFALHYIVNAFNHVTVMSGQLKLPRFLRSAFRPYVPSGVSELSKLPLDFDKYS